MSRRLTRRDHSGEVYGVLTVHGRHIVARNYDYYKVDWACCGVSATARFTVLDRARSNPPTMCSSCTAQARIQAEIEGAPGVMIPGTGPGRGWWPVIAGPMGPRWASNGWGPQQRRELSV